MHSQTLGQTFSVLAGFTVIGLGIGWLAGLSLSPVLAGIISALLLAVGALHAAVTGLSENKDAAPAAPNQQPSVASSSKSDRAFAAIARFQASPWPLAVMLVGLFLGTSAGNWARANDIFGKPVSPVTPVTAESLKAEIDPWLTHGMSQTLIMDRLFNLRYPVGTGTSAAPPVSQTENNPISAASGTGLYLFGTATGQDECRKISRKTNDELELLVLGELIEDGTRQGGSQNDVLTELFTMLADPQSFRNVVRILCASAK